MGMAVLSLILLVLTVHIVHVNDAVKETEKHAATIGLHVNAKLSNAVKVAEATEWLVRNNKLTAAAEADVDLIRTLPWIQSSEVSGVALLSDDETRVLYGKLDPSYSSTAWEKARWNRLLNRIVVEFKDSREAVTLFLGTERLYRTKQEFNQGQQLTGSIVLARAWKEVNGGWRGIVILLPIQSFNSLLRLGDDQYNSGNYDYLVDSDGFLLAHPSPSLVYGTAPNGGELRGAANRNEAGQYPINTRDSDWIAGNDTINKAFGSMLNHQPQTVVYKNLTNQYRLTSFRLVDLDKIEGKPFGVVAGRGLTGVEAWTTPILLISSTPLTSILWAVASVYVILISGWLAFISKFRSLHMDLLAWSRFMSPYTASRLGLLPIPTGTLKEYSFTNIVAIVMSVELDKRSRKGRQQTLELFARLCLKLQDDGWITHIWSFRSVIACRPLADPMTEDKLYLWSPMNVVDYIRTVDDFQLIQMPQENSNITSSRIVYGIGDLNIKAGRLGPLQRATISLFGNCIFDTIHFNEELGAHDPSEQGVLMYPIEEALDAGLQIVGDRVTVNSRNYAKLGMGKQNT
jgi:hypothetical protein